MAERTETQAAWGRKPIARKPKPARKPTQFELDNAGLTMERFIEDQRQQRLRVLERYGVKPS